MERSLIRPSAMAASEWSRMIRLGLAAYLTFVMTAGPALCCCTLKGWPSHSPANTQVKAETPIHEGCCCHRHASRKHDTAKPSRGSPPCSCPTKHTQPSFRACSDRSATQLGSREKLPQNEAVSAPPHVSTAVISPPQGCGWKTCGDFPFASAVDTLHRLHILRC
jgi:hypothetical protein